MNDANAIPTQVDPPNPLTRLRRINRIALVGLAAMVLLASVWAWWPSGDPRVVAPNPLPLDVAARSADQRAKPLALVAFGAPIWDPMPSPAALPTAAVAANLKPPPPLKLQLLGIARDPNGAADGTERFIAAIYDEAQDKLFMLRSGDTLGSLTVLGVDRESVEIADASGARRLAVHSNSRSPGMPLLDLLSVQPPRGRPVPAPTGSGGGP